jgi:hypothetical protein
VQSSRLHSHLVVESLPHLRGQTECGRWLLQELWAEVWQSKPTKFTGLEIETPGSLRKLDTGNFPSCLHAHRNSGCAADTFCGRLEIRLVLRRIRCVPADRVRYCQVGKSRSVRVCPVGIRSPPGTKVSYLAAMGILFPIGGKGSPARSPDAGLRGILTPRRKGGDSCHLINQLPHAGYRARVNERDGTLSRGVGSRIFDREMTH